MFLSGTLAGTAFGPFVGGVVVTFVNWRVIFWMQGGLSAVATIAVFFFLPETIHPGHKGSRALKGLKPMQKMRKLAQLTNPWRVIRLLQYKNTLAAVRPSVRPSVRLSHAPTRQTPPSNPPPN